jgi:23S rRNA (guanine2445-N2)-methyltransferase / 23S rRNA (guanine2069-N7)-methyltransferase
MSTESGISGGFFATCPAPLAELLAAELRGLGGRGVRTRGAGVGFDGDLGLAYRACLWSRIASRILLPLGTASAADGDALYSGARGVDWVRHLNPDKTFAVDCTMRGATITHSHYAALRVKDAIADRFREQTGRRPDVDTGSPDIRVQVHLRGSRARLALDLAGDSLHRRGYRQDSGPAPLRENLAAGVLMLAGWPSAADLPALLDPVCGSGTFLIEAAMLAGDVAPGLMRRRFGFDAWNLHRADLWEDLRADALRRRDRGLQSMPDIRGGDRDDTAIDAAHRNLQRAGLEEHVQVEVADLSHWQHEPPFAQQGLLVANPPYGARLEARDADGAREQIAALVHGSFRPWTKALLLPDEPGWPEGRTTLSLEVSNGAIPCRIHVLAPEQGATVGSSPVDATPLANRIARNRRRLKAWIRRDDITCYRIYDADLPEFNLAVDLYRSGDDTWALVQEYAAPPQIEPHITAARRDAALNALPDALGVAPERLVFTTRERQRGNAQYQRRARADSPGHDPLEVHEHGARLLVNLWDYLDTGLFLDHRPVRQWIQDNASQTRFLNLFAYTGAASVHAALGGALETLSIDLSTRYLEWTERNLALNGFANGPHHTLRADCIEWLKAPGDAGRFDLIFLDPPTFSNSKRMQGTFDVQRDHVELIKHAANLLSPDGTLVFSCNRKGFRLDQDALTDLDCTDWTRPSLPPDFSRPGLPHRCWMLTRR